MTSFVLDPRLSVESLEIGGLKLCKVWLFDDARFPWLVLVPQRRELVEIIDLDARDQALLTEDIATASKILKSATGCYKLNVAALGNQVRQLHVHIIARFENDAAWPVPVWGIGEREPYDPKVRDVLIAKLRKAFGFA
jgi:diadenosine tetraphosphate (Ap4A) HIT family hydrolase